MRLKLKVTSLILAILMLLTSTAIGGVSSVATSAGSQPAEETVEGGAILYCFDWSYNSIKANLASISAAGYTAVQTSPVQQPKDYSASYTDQSGQWWKLYQPLGLSVADGTTWLGTKAELKDLCKAADSYGIKVIVEIVANNLANNGSDGGGFENVNTGIEADLYNSEYFHSENTYVNDTDRYAMTQYHIGMPDLNTANSYVQGRVLGLLKECVDLGVDGFRFAGAKHIELPTDEGCASDFWPNIINGIKSYSGSDLFLYGEIFNGAGTEISNYTSYINVNDNYTGDYALYSAYMRNCGALADGTYICGEYSDDAVLAVESYDTYLGSAGSAGIANTAIISDDVIVNAWAIAGSRANSTSLFFARPASSMGAASTDTTWNSKAVAEVNKFKNYFNGTSEYLGFSDDYSATYNERGTTGVVISKLDGGGYVELAVNKMADGVYTDQVTGSTFSVSGGKISGTVGASGVAVVYNPGSSAPVVDTSSLYLIPSSNWKNDGARFAMYVFNRYTNQHAWASMTDPDGDGVYSAKIPEGEWDVVIFCRMDGGTTENDWDNKWNQTSDLDLINGYNCYTTAEGAWDNGGGSWSTITIPAPTETTSAAPTETTSAAPTEATSAAPTETTSTAPEETTSTAPAETTSAAPAETTSAAPAETTSTAPAETTSTAPAETTSAAPTETTEAVTSSTAADEIATGDINKDGEIDSLDASMALKYDAGIIDLDAMQLKAGDVNGDDTVDALDATCILKYDAGMIDSF